MGVRGLTGLLTRYAPNSIELHPLAAFKGTRIAIDGSLFLLQAVFRSYDGSLEIFPHRHIHSFYHLCRRLSSFDILPIFVFDDPDFSWPEKHKEKLRRRNQQLLDIRRLQLEKSRPDRVKELGRLAERFSELNVSERSVITADLQTSALDLQTSPSDLQKTLSVLQKTPSDLQESPSDLQKTLSVLQKTPSDLQKILSDLQKTPSDLQKTPSDLQKTPSVLQKTPSVLQKTLSVLQKTPSVLQKTLSVLQKTPSDLQESPSDLQKTLSDLQKTPSDLQESPSDLQTSPSNLQKTSPPDLQESPSDLQTSPSNLQKTSPPDLQESPSDLQTSPSNLQKTSPPDLQESPSDLQTSPSNLQTSPPDLQKSPSDLPKRPSDLQKSVSILVNYETIKLSDDVLELKEDIGIMATHIALAQHSASKNQKQLSMNEQALFNAIFKEKEPSSTTIIEPLNDSLGRILETSANLVNSYTLRTSITSEIRRQMQDEVIQFLKAMGAPVCISRDHEGEALAAHLASDAFGTEPVADMVASEDTDTMVFASGQTILLRKLAIATQVESYHNDFSSDPSFSNSNSKVSVMRIDPKQAKSELPGEDASIGSTLSNTAWIDLCILLGTDFCPTLPGIGPITARKWMREFGSIEEAIKAAPERITKKWTTANPTLGNTLKDWIENYLIAVSEARKVFNAKPMWPKDLSREEINWRDEDVDTLRALKKVHMISEPSFGYAFV